MLRIIVLCLVLRYIFPITALLPGTPLYFSNHGSLAWYSVMFFRSRFSLYTYFWSLMRCANCKRCKLIYFCFLTSIIHCIVSPFDRIKHLLDLNKRKWKILDCIFNSDYLFFPIQCLKQELKQIFILNLLGNVSICKIKATWFLQPLLD